MNIIGQNGNEGLHYDNEFKKQLEEAIKASQELLKETSKVKINEIPYVSDDFTIGPDGAFEMTEEILEDFSTIEPTEEDELQNFSTITSNTENIFHKEDYLGQFNEWDEEIALDVEITKTLNETTSETFSEEPTTLNTPIEEEQVFTIDDAPYEEFLKVEKELEVDDTIVQPNIEVEKKKY